ncbi:MAG: glycosyltransferase family 2 protein [Pseudomonadota bacterium]
MIYAATSKDAFDKATGAYEPGDGKPVMALCDKASFATAITDTCRKRLVEEAEKRVSDAESCRSLIVKKWTKWAAMTCALLLVAFCFRPSLVFTVFTAIAIMTLLATVLLKIGALVSVLPSLRTGRAIDKPDYTGLSVSQLPRISIMVPLYKETQIAQHLIARLQRLNYPRERLEVLLVTESDDLTTLHTLAQTRLPHWMRQVSVPTGQVKTKPRALNYALDHCSGSLIGVYDAEDAPDPDQLLTIAAHFARAEPEVACLQGRLDYYNPTQNWLARCFTMEYAAWFRVVLPGLARLKLPIPLGGTTLFFRRRALDALGGWDAHNVTEDADLGLRLARHGYRTELADTVTYEEANCRAWPWVRQRSRWLKGYAITYATHMRSPRRLLADLGLWGFLGVQVLFACTLAQFALAPVLWSFWAILFGIAHPLPLALPAAAFGVLIAFFILAEVLNIAVTVFGVCQTDHKRLWPWAFTMGAYFPLGTLAAYKGAYELAGRPFYWDKTSHGHALKSSDPNEV